MSGETVRAQAPAADMEHVGKTFQFDYGDLVKLAAFNGTVKPEGH